MTLVKLRVLRAVVKYEWEANCCAHDRDGATQVPRMLCATAYCMQYKPAKLSLSESRKVERTEERDVGGLAPT